MAAEEIRDHIECQIADNLSEGMSYEEAEKNAVTDMGDPVEVGISLDRIHKPKIAWKLLVIVGILSLLGILIQQSILRQPGYQELETWRQEVYRYTTEGFGRPNRLSGKRRNQRDLYPGRISTAVGTGA